VTVDEEVICSPYQNLDALHLVSVSKLIFKDDLWTQIKQPTP